MAIKEIHDTQMQEEALQSNGGLNQTSSNNYRYPDYYSPRLYRIYHDSAARTRRYVRPIERAGVQLGIAQVSTTGHHRMEHGAGIISNPHLEVDDPAAPERDCCATCDCRRFNGMKNTRSLGHVLWILDNALSLVSETIEDESECP